MVNDMSCAEYCLREACLEDAKQLWLWVNDSSVRQSSLNSQTIPWEWHLKWFTGKLASDDTRIFIAEDKEGNAVGQVRFDLVDAVYEIDYSVAAEFRSRGVGRFLVEAGMSWLKQSCPDSKFRAVVKVENIASLKIFEALGFDNCGEKIVSSFPCCVFTSC